MIRPATREDLERLFEMVKECHSTEREHNRAPVTWNLISAYFPHVLVLEVDLKLVGYCAWIGPLDDHPDYILGMGTFVDKKHRRNGWGRLLQRHAAVAAKERGGKYVVGIVGTENGASHALLQKVGWKTTGTEYRLDL